MTISTDISESDDTVGRYERPERDLGFVEKSCELVIVEQATRRPDAGALG